MNKTKINIEQVWLENEAEKVIGQIPRPFGTFETATYSLHQNKGFRYCFTTSNRTEEECVEIMKERFKLFAKEKENYMYIFKETASRGRKLIYTTDPQKENYD